MTIDDALVSVADLAAPVLRRLDVPALLFAPSGLLQETAGWLPAPADEPILGPESFASCRRTSASRSDPTGTTTATCAGSTPPSWIAR